MDDRYFIEKAIKLAAENVKNGNGGPFGAVIVKNGEIVATGVNSVTSVNDPTAHAEIVAIRNACKALNDYQLDGCVIYSSCEPCPMCLGAIYWSRPAKLVFAATKNDAAKAGFDDELIYKEMALPLNNRKLQTKLIDHPEKLQPFLLWSQSPEKRDY